MCNLCNIPEFLKGQEWKIFRDDEVIVNYSKEPAVDGHLVAQPKRHVKRITQLNENEWSELSKALYRYSKAIERALNERAKRQDQVNKIYIW